jgi:homoserine kinase
VIHAKAPASTANLGPGFDAAAAALDLWNELSFEEGPFALEVEGEGADELPRDGTHLALRAFAVYADPERYRFRFTNRIPLERGLGSSAAAIGLGLVAGAAAAGRPVSADDLLVAAVRFEGHADNLAAVLNGGVCVTWQSDGAPRARRIAADMPVTPILAVPSSRTSTAHSRNGLPSTIAHGDAAANAGAATLLGAAIVAGDAELLRHAFRDRLHERYRAAGAPLLEELRRNAPAGAVGVTLSGSGPSVVVWADKRREAEVLAALEHTVSAETRIVPLRVASEGAQAA